MAAEQLIRQHDRLAWAAYVLGHHPLFLWQWQSNEWGARMEAAEGRRRVAGGLPAEADELLEAVELVAQRKLPDPDCAAELAGAASRWKHTASEMLRELRHPWGDDSYLDWEEPRPEGSQHSAALVTAAKRAFGRDEHLARWQAVGEWVAERRTETTYLQGDNARELCARFGQMNDHGEDYPFLVHLHDAVLGRAVDEGARAAHRHVFDPVLKQVTIGRVESFVRSRLSAGAWSEPWLSLSSDSVRFLGMELPAQEFRRAELGILWVLAENPRSRVSCQTLTGEVSLNCKPENLKAHVSRLKRVLQVAVPSFLRRTTNVPGTDECFIKGHEGAYELLIDVTRVEFRSARPPSMGGSRQPFQLPRSKSSPKAKTAFKT